MEVLENGGFSFFLKRILLDFWNIHYSTSDNIYSMLFLQIFTSCFKGESLNLNDWFKDYSAQLWNFLLFLVLSRIYMRSHLFGISELSLVENYSQYERTKWNTKIIRSITIGKKPTKNLKGIFCLKCLQRNVCYLT